MVAKSTVTSRKNCMVAFIFDSGEFNTPFYGAAAVEAILKGNELKANRSKIIVSVGDILSNDARIDIGPYVISDDLCSISWATVVKSEAHNSKKLFELHIGFKDCPFVVLMEDIEKIMVYKIDTRLHKECRAYIGVTSIDVESVDQRKQFWKNTIRLFSLEGEICTVFGEMEEGFAYEEKVIEGGYKIHYDGFMDDIETDNRTALFSTRQSSFIHHIEQLEWIDGKNDSDRGILKMNFALVKELEIAGVEIWKAIEDINRIYLRKSCDSIIVDYIFTSFYQAAQGIERLLKILVELIAYIDKNVDKRKTDNLLHGHNHIALADYLAKKDVIKFDSPCRKLLQILTKFYNVARYNRYIDTADDKLELALLQELGKPLKEEGFNEEFKKLYGKLLGKISRTSYKAINELSYKIGIFVYELNACSVACIVFWDSYQENLYKSLLEMNSAKMEMLWYLIYNGEQVREKYHQVNITPLSFDGSEINEFISGMINGDWFETDIQSFVEEEYCELQNKGKNKVKSRLDFFNYLFSRNGITECFRDNEFKD